MTVNLLPPKLKKQKEIIYIIHQVSFGLMILILLLGIMTFALFVYNSSIRHDIAKSENLLAEQSRQSKESKELEKSVRKINQKLGRIDEILNSRILWSEIIVEISSLTPKEVQIKNMSMKDESKNVSISGVASTRKDIAVFKEKLEKAQFKNVTFTSSSYNQNTDDYTFSLSLATKDKK